MPCRTVRRFLRRRRRLFARILLDRGIADTALALQQIRLHFYLLMWQWTDLRLECLISRQYNLDRVRPWRHQHSPPDSIEFAHVSDKESVHKDRGSRRIYRYLHRRGYSRHHTSWTF